MIAHTHTLSSDRDAANAGFSSAEIVWRDGKPWLIAATSNNAEIQSWNVSETISEGGVTALMQPFGHSAPTTLLAGALDGMDIVWSFGNKGGGFTAYSVDNNGALIEVLSAGEGRSPITSLAHIATNSGEFIYTTSRERSEIDVWQRSPSGQVTLWQTVPTAQSQTGTDDLNIRATVIDGTPLLLSVSSSGHSLASYAFDASVGLVLRDQVGAENGFGVAIPTAIELVELEGETLAIIASSGSNSLSVLAVSPNGMLEARDQVIDDLDTRFFGVTSIEVIRAETAVYIVATGTDEGLSLFSLLPDGPLVHHNSIASHVDHSLEDVTALTAQYDAGALTLFTASEGTARIEAWSFATDPGELKTATATGGLLAGSLRDDTLIGLDGDDHLNGSSGRDVLVDGAGFDTLTGGAGDDLFILTADGSPDRIAGFEVGSDRIDLTGWGRVYAKSALTFQELNNGIRISYRDEQLDIISADFQTISADILNDTDLFGVSHVDVGLSVTSEIWQGTNQAEVYNGNRASDFLSGLEGDDALFGGAGNDILNGGAGADTLDGGAGIDTADYTGAVGSLRVDLLFPEINTNMASGDTYLSIENLVGSQGRDNLRGSLEDNLIQGARNVDFLYGRRGDDTLMGGIGDDVLFGGVGRDMLDGGPGRDRAQYSESLSSVVADLQDPLRNTNEAQGDVFIDIEDLAGSQFDDHLFGDSADNRLFGRAGLDQLYGREGNDYLNGGAHSDRLDGGAGDDVLRGGTHNDTFVFNGGADVIEDFTLSHADRIAIEQSLFPHLSGLTAKQVLDQYSSSVNGSVMIDLEGGNTLTLLGISDVNALDSSLFLF